MCVMAIRTTWPHHAYYRLGTTFLSMQPGIRMQKAATEYIRTLKLFAHLN